MHLLHLYVKNFRNLQETTFSFDEKINLIHGANAQGKTNILEALYLLTTGKSHRTQELKDLIEYSASYFYVAAEFKKNDVVQQISYYYDGKARKIKHNDTWISSLSGLIGILHMALLSPQDSQIVKGAPAFRRHYLDMQIAQGNPLYLHHLTRYFKGLKQRNECLKKKELRTIAIWEKELAKSAAFIIQQRLKAINRLSLLASSIYQQLSSYEKDLFSLDYLSPFKNFSEDLEEKLVQAYEKNRPREIALGWTLIGPHREDSSILINAKEAKYFASEGQIRSAIAALKLAEFLHIQEMTSINPLMGIDDLSISLDAHRKESLMHYLQTLNTQVMITIPELTLSEPHWKKAASFHIEQGKVTDSITFSHLIN